MEATTTDKLTWEWMQIGLACTQTQTHVTFTITFRNESNVTQELPFSNRSRKAEYWGLQVEDGEGCKVAPERTHIFTPRVPDPDLHVLVSGQLWAYDLVGEVTEDGLEFPASLFRLHRGKSYCIIFKYKGMASNQVAFKLS